MIVSLIFFSLLWYSTFTSEFKSWTDKTLEFNLNLIIIKSELSKNKQIDRNGNFFYVSDPDYCCHVNKVQPMEVPLSKYDIWINGIRKDQSKERSKLSAFEKSKFNCLRYHPIIDWTQKDIYSYNKSNLRELPFLTFHVGPF